MITLVLAVPIINDGQLTEEEALAVLNVSDMRPKRLLFAVHPQRNMERVAEAEAATRRVNQAMDVRSRHVTEVNSDHEY